MSHKRVVAWKVLRKALLAKGISVGSRGSEAKLSRRNPDGTRTVYILQHECCRGPNAMVWAIHLHRIVRKFDLTDKDLDD